MIWKAISLWEPYGSAIACGAKRNETRSWATAYRGPLLICTAKRRFEQELTWILTSGDWQKALAPLAPDGRVKPYHLSFGCAVATCDLVDCVPSEEANPSDWEVLFGDYTPGRFAWRLDNVVRLAVPLPVAGRQGFFNVGLSADLTAVLQ